MELTVSQEMARRAEEAGACEAPRVGTPFHRLSQDQLDWAAAAEIVRPGEHAAYSGALAAAAGAPFLGLAPLWGFSGDGSGYGYGDGSGDGSGYGYGYGYGSGYGYGDGDGSGYGRV